MILECLQLPLVRNICTESAVGFTTLLFNGIIKLNKINEMERSEWYAQNDFNINLRAKFLSID